MSFAESNKKFAKLQNEFRQLSYQNYKKIKNPANPRKEMKFDFKSQNLSLDYLTIRINNLTNMQEVNLLANYFVNIGYNSTLKTSLWSKTAIQYHYHLENRPEHSICFTVSNAFWFGTAISFNGRAAKHFYIRMKEEKLKLETIWDILKLDVADIKLSRFDLNYFRPGDESSEEIENFFRLIYQKRPPSMRVKITKERGSDGNEILLIWVGGRKSQNCYRIYQKKNGRYVWQFLFRIEFVYLRITLFNI